MLYIVICATLLPKQEGNLLYTKMKVIVGGIEIFQIPLGRIHYFVFLVYFSKPYQEDR